MQNQPEKKPIPILMYHSIADTATPIFKEFAVSPLQFDEQMAYLSTNNYTPVNVTQLVRARAHKGVALPEKPVVITFDDGFADFYTDALPTLKKYDLTATLYVATDFVNGTSRWLDYVGEGERPMITWEQLAEINAAGIECGAHTRSHPHLDTLPVSKAREEIESSKKLLEDHLGQEVPGFAYPFGHFTGRVRQLVQELGFQSACAVRYAFSPENDNPFSLARLQVSEGMSLDAFAALLAGSNAAPDTAMQTLYRYARTLPPYTVQRCSATMKRYSYWLRKEKLVG